MDELRIEGHTYFATVGTSIRLGVTTYVEDQFAATLVDRE
jgi:hypothetical protein